MYNAKIKSADGKVVIEGEREPLIRRYLERHRGCRIWWGDHYRVMERRKDPESLMHKCKQKGCKHEGEQLHVTSSLTREAK